MNPMKLALVVAAMALTGPAVAGGVVLPIYTPNIEFPAEFGSAAPVISDEAATRTTNLLQPDDHVGAKIDAPDPSPIAKWLKRILVGAE